MNVRDEHGFTLAEVLVAMMVGLIVVFGVGSLLLGAMSSDTRVRNITQASNTAQLIHHDLDLGLQNASAMRVDHGQRPGDLLLRARVAEVVMPEEIGPAPSERATFQWRCRGYYFRASTGELFTFWGALGGISGANAIPAPTPTMAGWYPFADGIRALEDGVFIPGGAHGEEVGTIRVSIAVEYGTGETAVATESTHDVSRIVMPEQEQQKEPSTCW